MTYRKKLFRVVLLFCLCKMLALRVFKKKDGHVSDVFGKVKPQRNGSSFFKAMQKRLRRFSLHPCRNQKCALEID